MVADRWDSKEDQEKLTTKSTTALNKLDGEILFLVMNEEEDEPNDESQ